MDWSGTDCCAATGEAKITSATAAPAKAKRCILISLPVRTPSARKPDARIDRLSETKRSFATGFSRAVARSAANAAVGRLNLPLLEEPYRAARMSEPAPRKLAGITLILLLIGLWAAFVASLAPLVGKWPVLVQAPYYLFMGVAWVIPLKPLIRWTETGSFRARP